MRQFTLPALGEARAIRGVEHLKLLFEIVDGVALEIEFGKVRAVVGARPVDIEAQVFGQELFEGLFLHHFKGAHVDAEELGRDLGVLVGVFAVRHDDDGQPLIAVMGRAGGLPAALFTDVGQGGPQGYDVADAVFKGGEGRCLIHVLDDHVLVGQAEGLEPRAEGEMGGRDGRAENGFALHAFRRAIDVGIALVIALGGHDGAVGTDHNGVDHRLVIAVGDDGGIVAQRADHGGNGPHAAEDPRFGRKGVQGVHAGIEVEHLHIKADFLVPALLLGVPDGEGFLCAHPRRGHFLQFGSAGRTDIGDAKRRGHQATKPFFDVHAVLLCCLG